MRLIGVLLAGGLCGCNAILGIGEVHSNAGAVDAPPGAADASVAVDAGPSDVNGTAIDTYVNGPTTTQTAPEDLSGETLQAYVPDGKGGFVTIAGTGKSDGTFTIPQVPAGPYYLVLGAAPPSYYVTTSRTPDLGTVRFGRFDGPQVTQSTPVDFKMTGMTPAQANDALEIDSFADGCSTSPFGFDAPPVGATTADLPVDWQSVGLNYPQATPLLQTGEDVWVLHYRPFSELYGTILETGYQLVDAYTSTTLGLTDGVSATVNGTFTSVGMSKSQIVNISATAFYQGLDVTPDRPMLVGFRRRVALSGEFALSQYGVLELLIPLGQPQQFAQFGANYGDPFPASWLRYTFDNEEPGWTYVTRGSGLHTVYTSEWTFQRRVATDTVAIAPFAAAPHTIKVGGVLAGAPAAVPFDGTHSVDVTWAPVTSINHYLVTVMQLDATGGAASLDLVATFDTSLPQVTMPASLFTLGSSYVLSIAAQQQGDVDYPGGKLRQFGFPRSAREAVTARLLFASSCGNGAVDAAYEECDSSGVATATCNPDCTKSACGDGVANSVAGEACDTGGDSLICDSDCTPVVCGDGHVNTVAGEACDLGAQNGMAGQCCSATCTLVAPATHCP